MYTTKYMKKPPKTAAKRGQKVSKFENGGSVAAPLNATPRPPAIQAPRPVPGARPLHPAIQSAQNRRAEIAMQREAAANQTGRKVPGVDGVVGPGSGKPAHAMREKYGLPTYEEFNERGRLGLGDMSKMSRAQLRYMRDVWGREDDASADVGNLTDINDDPANQHYPGSAWYRGGGR